MPNEVIEQVHYLAAATEKYEGILLRDINGNIITVQFTESDDEDKESLTKWSIQNTGVATGMDVHSKQAIDEHIT